MTTEETRAVVERYYDALGAGNREALLELLAVDCEWVPPSTAPFAPMTGGEAIAEALGRKVVRTMFDVKQPFALDIHQTVVEGSTAVVRQRIRATAFNGNAYDNEYCWVYECAEGRISRMVEYADTLLASRVMGWESEQA